MIPGATNATSGDKICIVISSSEYLLRETKNNVVLNVDYKFQKANYLTPSWMACKARLPFTTT